MYKIKSSIINSSRYNLFKIVYIIKYGIFNILDKVFNKFFSKRFIVQGNYINLYINPGQYIYPFIYFLSYQSLFKFNTLLDIICVDYISFKYRFNTTYVLLSLKYNFSLHVHTYLKNIPIQLSITSIFLSAAWLEREIYEFFSVYFILNKDLRHLLLDYGFQGFPLLKDFPLSGFIEVFYNDNTKKINYTALSLSQLYRDNHIT